MDIVQMEQMTARPSGIRFQTLPFLMLVFLVGLRLILLAPAYAEPLRFVEADSLQYIQLARSVWLTGEYRVDGDDAFDLVRPPGWPAFVLVGLVVGNGSLRAVVVLQGLLVLVTAALVWRTGLALGGQKPALAAVLIFLANPNAAFWSTMLLTETLTGLLLMLAVWCVARYWQSGSRGRLLLGGLWLSAAAVTRPIVLPLAMMVALLLAWVEWLKKRSFKAAIHTLAIAALGVFSLVLPWQLRNAYVHGRFTLSEVGESTFRNWIVAKTMAEVEGMSREEAVARIAASENPTAYSVRYVADHPSAFLREQVRGVARTLLGAEYVTWAARIGGVSIQNAGMLSALLDDRSMSGFISAFAGQMDSVWFWAAVYALVYDGLLYGLCIAALRGTTRAPGRAGVGRVVLLLVVTLAYLLIAPLGAGDSRFRAPADPLLGLMAGLALIGRGQEVS